MLDRRAIALLLACCSLFASAAIVEKQIEFKNIIKTNAQVPGSLWRWGQVRSSTGAALYEVDPATKGPSATPLVSNNPDFTTLHEASLGKKACNSGLVRTVGGKKMVYAVTQFESPRPGTMWVTGLEQGKDGSLTPKGQYWGGLWIPCAGSKTPWGSHMGGEEYEPDARPFSEAKTLDELKALLKGGWGDVEGFMANGNASPPIFFYLQRYFNLYPKDLTFANVMSLFNPYKYGHIVEVKVSPTGNATPLKHYTLGRAAWEMGYVMPDQRTVYGTDDGTNVGFFKFVADRRGDLSRGRLYAAKMTQLSAANGGKFAIQWIHMGYGENWKLQKLAERVKFSDIFATAPFNPATGCPLGFKSINADDNGAECLQLKRGMETAAAFLETRRYAAYLGATTEFSKWEGITFDAKRGLLYTAMSDIRYGMEDNKSKGKAETKYDIGGPNHIRLEYNKCGCVYKLAVDRRFSAYAMEALICGKPITNDPNNACDLNAISNPDNVAIAAELDVLLISEDSDNHENNVLWSYDLPRRVLQRILSVPYGAEVTSPYYYNSINGFSYVIVEDQHPYSGNEDKVSSPFFSGKDAFLGYWTWPTVKNGYATAFLPITPAQTEQEKHQVRGTTKVAVWTYGKPYQARTMLAAEAEEQA
ncbi:hypothetical protein COHA_007040 [Chlorella ohadii]|uniref:Alkaline phosphatase n=1 Tax=Chlorella ohadii TaxID=2649997 RepID=A0AAD5H4N7_9CHLO|nr:hypothetical protein COHA_007040 [Chlorella ohadii]